MLRGGSTDSLPSYGVFASATLFGGGSCPGTVGGVCRLSSLQSVCVWVSGLLVVEAEADVARLCFPVSGAMGGMSCLWSEEGGELNCCVLLSFTSRLRLVSSGFKDFKTRC